MLHVVLEHKKGSVNEEDGMMWLDPVEVWQSGEVNKNPMSSWLIPKFLTNIVLGDVKGCTCCVLGYHKHLPFSLPLFALALHFYWKLRCSVLPITLSQNTRLC